MSLHLPFCCDCDSAIPATFTHLLALVPEITSHVLMAISPIAESAGLVTTFLTSAAMSRVYHSAGAHLLPPSVVLRPGGSFIAIIQVTKRIASNGAEEVSKKWFAPYGAADRERIMWGNTERLFWVRWSQISEKEADECLRPEGCGIEIGDGEKWEELSGVETLWCDDHSILWEMIC